MEMFCFGMFCVLIIGNVTCGAVGRRLVDNVVLMFSVGWEDFRVENSSLWVFLFGLLNLQ